jgi:hypothetical protein
VTIDSRLTKLEAAADVAAPERITIVVQRVDMAALRADPNAKVVGREVRRIVVTRRPS